MTRKKIRVNMVQCRKCGDVIVSRHRWDFVRCSCGAIAVDGGLEYLKRVGYPSDCKELSEWEPVL